MKKIIQCLLFLSFLGFIFFSCNPMLGSYYYQQQGRGLDSTDIDNNSGSNTVPVVVPPLSNDAISMFSVIRENGIVIEPFGNTKVETMLRGKLKHAPNIFKTADFIDRVIQITEVTSGNLPQTKFQENVKLWQPANEHGWQVFNGDNFSSHAVMTVTVKNVGYFRVKGKNPLVSSYDGILIPIYGSDGKPTEQTEPIMKRFVFYRFTGDVPVVGTLDNRLVAFDSYTGLLFVYAIPTTFGGNGNPLGWQPLEGVGAPDGKKHSFYEYDPVGYVNKDGEFRMTSQYITNLKKKTSRENYKPPFTGKSPYSDVLKRLSPFTVEFEKLYGTYNLEKNTADTTQYKLEYKDDSIESASIAKTVFLHVKGAKLKESPVKISHVLSDGAENFINVEVYNDSLKGSDSNGGKNSSIIRLELKPNRLVEQSATLTLNFSADSNVYDAENSPKIITINITRSSYNEVSVSNLKIHNISVTDSWGNPVGDVTTNPEFKWNIRAKVNEDNFINCFVNETKAETIEKNKSYIDDKSTVMKMWGRAKTENTVTVDVSLFEEDDTVTGLGNDIFLKHGKPSFPFSYNPISKKWEYTGQKSFVKIENNKSVIFNLTLDGEKLDLSFDLEWK